MIKIEPVNILSTQSYVICKYTENGVLFYCGEEGFKPSIFQALLFWSEEHASKAMEHISVHS